MKHIALYFGSFNPIHECHLRSIESVKKHKNSPNEIWVVVLPATPDKPISSLAPFEDRVNMVKAATVNIKYLEVSRIALNLPIPSRVFRILRYLHIKHPEYKFSIIAGTDVVNSIPNWEFVDEILAHHFYVIERGESINPIILEDMFYTKIPPVGSTSSREIRENIKKGGKPYGLLDTIYEYILGKNLYL